MAIRLCIYVSKIKTDITETVLYFLLPYIFYMFGSSGRSYSIKGLNLKNLCL